MAAHVLCNNAHVFGLFHGTPQWMEARRKKQTGLAMKRLSGNDPRLKDAAMLSCSHEQH
jgi:hypothetical protein